MTPPKGRRVAALPGSAPKRRKNAKDKAAAANLALMIKAQAKRIEVREAACDVRDAEAAKREEHQSVKDAKREEQQSKKEENQEQQRVALSASLTAREVALERREAAFEQRMKEEALAKEEILAKATTPQRQARQKAAAVARDDLARRRGALLDASQSRDILLLYYDLVQSGMEENTAVARTSEHMRVGKGKVFKVRAHWEDHNTFLTSSGEGRGAAAAEDGRRVLSSEQCAKLRAFISAKHESGKQVFRRTVGEWIKQECNVEMSNRAVGGLLYRLRYRRRRGRIKIPPLNEERKARIRRFLVEMGGALSEEEAETAVIVYMDESFVHQLHGSAYSYFFMDEAGVVQDGMGRTSGKGLRVIMVHAITKDGPLVSRDADNFPIAEGWFKPKDKGKGRQGRGDMGTEKTAEMLWQAKIATGDYHAAMTDTMFMEWLERRLTPAFKAAFGDKKMILVLDNASYHHGYDSEVGVPETNTKMHNTVLLRKYGAGKITVQREESDGKGGKKVVTRNFEVPESGSFPNSNSKSGNGVTGAELALATRSFFQLRYPKKLMEKVESFMHGHNWQLIWTPPYMPTFQPIELFWQHGKQYVSFNFETKRNMAQVWEQVRKGWYGDSTWKGQEGGWKAANCSKLVEHAIKEMDKWVVNDPVLSGSMRALVVPQSYLGCAPRYKGVVNDEGVEAEEALELSGEYFDFMGEGDADGDALV